MFSPIKIGMDGRFLSGNWHTARDEIVFAKMAGFSCIQFPGMVSGLSAQRIGDPLDVVGIALRRARITAVMKIVISLYSNGLTAEGRTPMDILHANVQAIQALNCSHVHWLILAKDAMTPHECYALEQDLIPQLEAAVALGRKHHFIFAIEHNPANVPLFCSPQRCAETLTAVPGLHFVWDINHTAKTDLPAFTALASKTSLLHVSDTPWPLLNHHLPLEKGNLDLSKFIRPLLAAGFSGNAVIEIGGFSNSVGFGQDTNDHLIDSLSYLQTHIQAAM